MSFQGEVRSSAFSSFSTVVGALVFGAMRGVSAIGRALHRRTVLNQLAEFDDVMLRDIGLTRGDLRDSAASPIWQDPTRVLVMRAVERRTAQRRLAADRIAAACASGSAAANGCEAPLAPIDAPALSSERQFS